MSSVVTIARTAAMIVAAASSLGAQRIAAPISRPPLTTLSIEQPLAAPANVTVTPSGTQATLRWDAVPGATGYLITRTSALYGTIQQTPTPITATTFTDVSQQFDSRYLFTYKVMAVYPDGRYAATEVSYLPAPASVSFPAPSGGCYDVGPRYTTTWSAVPEATSYIVRYKIAMTTTSSPGSLGMYIGSIDTLVTVPAPRTSDYMLTYGGTCYGNIVGLPTPSRIDAATVAAVFANGKRSAETVCTGGSCSPPPWPNTRITR